jgi:hypothetical protein
MSEDFIDIHLEGVDELSRKINDLCTASMQKAIEYALVAAAGPIFGAISSRAELHDRSDSETSTGGADFGGHLADDLATTIELSFDGQSGRMYIGFKRQAAKAIWLEYGHLMVSHKPDRVPLEGTRTPGYFVVPGGTENPGPFMRPAFDESAEQATELFFKTFIRIIEEEWGSTTESNRKDS